MSDNNDELQGLESEEAVNNMGDAETGNENEVMEESIDETMNDTVNETVEDSSTLNEEEETEDRSTSNEAFSPFMEPKKSNTKKGVIAVAALGVVAVLTLCICLILLRDREKKVGNPVETENTSTDDKTYGTSTEASTETSAEGSSETAEEGNASDIAQNLLEEEVSYPEVDVVLGDYKGLNVIVAPVEVSDEDVQAELDYLLSSTQIVEEITERSDVQSGDVAVIDYVGSVDGVEFEGGSEEGHELEIGSGAFIEGFEDQIIGHKVGEKFDINVTFPEDYPSADLAGKEAVFNITIHKIGYYAAPELTDEFIASNTEYSNIEEYKEGTYNSLLQAATDNAQTQKEMDLINLAVENTAFNGLSEEEIQANSDEMKAYYEQMASYYGMDLTTFISLYFGMDEATFQEEVTKAAELQVKEQYLLKKIIEVENIEVTEEDYQAGLEKYAAMYSFETSAEFESYYGRETIEGVLLTDKALAVIIDSAIESAQ